MQEKLVPIFNRLKKLLKKYEDPLKPKFDLDSKYDLWSFKDLEIAGRKRKEVYFAGLIIQSTYVGFIYFLLDSRFTRKPTVFASGPLHRPLGNITAI